LLRRSCRHRDRGLKRLAIIAILLATAAFPALAQPAASRRPFVERPESDLLLLAVKVNQETVSDSLPAYPLDKGIIVPLGEIARLLDLAIETHVNDGSADGFFIREDRRFHLDTTTATVTVQGRQSSYDRSKVEVHQDDIYVATDLLAKWFPADFVVDLYTAQLVIKPREPLPMQVRAERERMVQKSLASLGYGGPKYPLVPNPYRLFDGPFVDQTLRLIFGRQTSNGTSLGFQYSTMATGDLLGLETNIFAAGDNTSPFSDLRVSMGRRDPDAALLGPMHAREFGLGEVFHPGLDLIALPSSGPGLLVSSYPLQQQNQFDRHTFIGDLPIGWEVELYRNDALIAYQQSRKDGRYDFENIPLLFGINIFRLVFYGPQGQRRQLVETYNVGQTLTPPGSFYYRVMANDPEGRTRRSLAQFSYGVSRHLSAEAALSTVELDDGDHEYVKAGVQSYFSRFFTRADVAYDQRGGSAVSGAVQTRIGPVSIALIHSQLHDFESEFFLPTNGKIDARTTLHLSGALQTHAIPPVSISLDVDRDRLADGGDVYRLSNLVSALYGRTSVANRFDGVVFSGTGQDSATSVSGVLLVSRYLRSLSLRGEVDYSVRPTHEVDAIGLTTELRPWPDYLLDAQLLRALSSGVTHLIFGITRDQGPLSYGIDADVASTGDVLIRLSVSAGLARNPFTSKWVSQARSIAGRGAAAVDVFLDTNGNGVRDPGEKPVEGASFVINRSSDATLTDKRGQALLTNLPADVPTDIAIAPSSLEDPLWVPEKPGVRFVPRGGKALDVQFPILVSGEITGSVFVTRGGQQREAPGVELQLIDAGGAVVKSTRTAYDGFYDLTNVVPGKYTLRANPEQAVRIGLSGPMARQVTILPTGTIIDGLNFVLTLAEPPVLTAEAAPLAAPAAPAQGQTTAPSVSAVAPPAAAPALPAPALPAPPAVTSAGASSPPTNGPGAVAPPPAAAAGEAAESARVAAEAKARDEQQREAARVAEDKRARAVLEQKTRLEAEQKAKLEAEQKAKLEAEQKAKLEAEQKAKLEAEQKAKLEAEQKAKADEERLARVEEERKEALRLAEARSVAEAAAAARTAALQGARELVRQEKYREAIAGFDRLAPLMASEGSYRYDRAVALYEVGRYAEAKEELAAALPSIEASPEVERYRAKIEGAIVWTTKQ
jgi:hypothetical protein